MNSRHKTGFTLIEILVALLIGSLLTVSLYQILQNVQRSVTRIISVVDLNTPVIGFYNQLQQDTLGIFTPRNTASEKKSGDAENKAQKGGGQGQTQQIPGQQGQAQQGQAGKDKYGKQEKKIENIFVCTSEGLNFSCNFITTGGMKLIGSTGSYIPAPYNKRVVYALEPDKSRPGLYILTYGQTEDLDVSSVKTISRYELMRNIKKFEASFKIFEPVPKKEGQEKSTGKEKQKPKLVSVSRFSSKDMFKKYQSHIPAFIEIKGSYIDPRLGLEFFFKYILEVPAYRLPDAKKEQEGAVAKPGSPAAAQVGPQVGTPTAIGAGQPAGLNAPASSGATGIGQPAASPMGVPASLPGTGTLPAPPIAPPAGPTVGPVAMNNLPNQKNSLAGFVP